MPLDLRIFQASLEAHEQLREEFSRFTEFLTKQLSDNREISGLVLDEDANSKCQLSVYGRTFEIDFEMVQFKSGWLAVLELSLVVDTEEHKRVMVRWYFDESGNVRKAPDDKWMGGPLHGSGFVIELLNALAVSYVASVESRVHDA